MPIFQNTRVRLVRWMLKTVMVMLIKDELVNPPTWFSSFRDLTLVCTMRLHADIVIETKDTDLCCRKPRGGNGFHRRFCDTQAGGGYSYRYRAKLRPIHCPRPNPSRKYPFALQSDTIRHYAVGDYQADLSVSRDHWEPRWQTLFASTFSDLDTQRPIDNIRAFFT